MAKVFLVGIQELDFDTKEGNHISGYSLHVAYPDEHFIGRKTDKKFISSTAFKNLGFSLDEISVLVDHNVDLETNIDGKVVGIHEA